MFSSSPTGGWDTCNIHQQGSFDMAMKKHHKFMIGSFSSVLIIILVSNTIFIYILYAQLQVNSNQLERRIVELQEDTQFKINEIADSLIETREGISKLDESLTMEIGVLKATTGDDFSGIVDSSIKSVVSIRTDVGQGTGFIITNQGHVVTNAHVLAGGSTVNALTYEQDIVDAEFIGFDPELDIALLQIPGNHDVLELADSDDIQIGENVIAIGNPLGLQFSVSEGIVSGVERVGINELEAYIQTDAALNPGNSGGPLINKDGEVIGINNFKVGGGENLGFALDSNHIKDAVNDIALENLNQTLI